ncbi:MAG: hypothetical protein ABI700_29990 [Chloroflexota bacterium]
MIYDEWITAIFDHAVTDPAWYFQGYEAPELWDLTRQPETAVQLMTQTFGESGNLPQTFSDGQIADGINYIINNSCSDLPFAIYEIENGVPLEARLKCLESFYSVYQQLFAPRCSPDLGHTIYDNRPVSPLNYPCYMWWDMTPISGHPDDPRYVEIDQTILNVMAKTLTIDSLPCCEGALHGLGHWHDKYPQQVEAIIDAFLAEDREVSRRMRSYALAARTGGIM